MKRNSFQNAIDAALREVRQQQPSSHGHELLGAIKGSNKPKAGRDTRTTAEPDAAKRGRGKK